MNGKLFIKRGTKVIGSGSFEGNCEIVLVRIPDGCNYINDFAFHRCMSLKEVIFPSRSVMEIGVKAFACTNLEKIVVPDTVEFIDRLAFAFNHRLRSVHIGKDVAVIRSGAFTGCPMLEEITVDPENLYYYVENGCLIEKKTKKLIAATYPYKIPEGVEIIDRQTFLFLTNCNVVTIPSSVKAIYMQEGEPGNFYMCKEIANAGGTVTIKAPSGSYAETFARNHNINFEEDKE